MNIQILLHADGKEYDSFVYVGPEWRDNRFFGGPTTTIKLPDESSREFGYQLVVFLQHFKYKLLATENYSFPDCHKTLLSLATRLVNYYEGHLDLTFLEVYTKVVPCDSAHYENW